MIFSGYSVAYSNILLLFKGWYCRQNAQCFPFRICGYNLLIFGCFDPLLSEKLPVADNLAFILEGNNLV